MTWIWTATAWTLFAASLALLVRSAFWDRPGVRGRPARRCRTCWYDLTETSAELPVTCPECGRRHPTARSMRRTHRHWGRIVIALLLLWAGWHGHATRQAVASRGLIAGVPSPALAVPVAWMDARPGSIRKGDSNQASPFEMAVAKELIARPIRRIGPTTRAIMVAIGKRQSPEIITDPNTLRGQVYTELFQQLYADRRLTAGQARWARSVAWASFQTRPAWHPEVAAFGTLQTRTLVGGPYSVSVLNAPGHFEAGYPSLTIELSMSSFATTPANPARRANQGYWDALQPVRDELWRGWYDHTVALIEDDFAASGTVTVIFESVEPQDPWFRPGMIFATVDAPTGILRDAATGGPVVLDDTEVGAWLGASLRARLVPVSTGSWGGAWRSALHLVWTGNAEGETTTFGGRTSIVLKRADPRRPDEVLLAGEGCWFRADFSGPDPVVRARTSGHSGRAHWFAAFVEDTSRRIPAPIPGDRLVVRIEPERFEPHRSVFADLVTPRVYLGIIEIELENWTVEEINRLRVSGVWPDHALKD